MKKLLLVTLVMLMGLSAYAEGSHKKKAAASKAVDTKGTLTSATDAKKVVTYSLKVDAKHTYALVAGKACGAKKCAKVCCTDYAGLVGKTVTVTGEVVKATITNISKVAAEAPAKKIEEGSKKK